MTVEDLYIKKESYYILSREAKDILWIIVNTPAEIVELLKTIPLGTNSNVLVENNMEKIFCKRRLQKFFGMIWGKRKIKKVVEELNEYVKELYQNS